MLTIHFPFDLDHPEMKRGFEQGESPEYQSTKPVSDTELAALIWDFLKDDEDQLVYNVGFLLGLYGKTSETVK